MTPNSLHFSNDTELRNQQVFTKIEEIEDILIIVVGLEQSKGVKLNALKESVAFLRDIKYIDRLDPIYNNYHKNYKNHENYVSYHK